MPLQENATLGPYQLGGLIGEGGMGAVYRARDTRLGRDVAIKVLTNVTLSDRERLMRFEQEARAAGMLNHPNLLTIFDVGRDPEGNPFLVSELLSGDTLSTRLLRGPLSPRRAIDAALQMAQGLAAAHDKGIVHRDLKPDNVFLTRDGRLKILDFGIAKLTGAAAADGPTFRVAATEPGMVLGTVGYMSPEQVRGEAVDHRSDIFSFGAILYEMLTGTRAFKRNSGIETLSAILREEPPDLSDVLPNVPPALDRLVRRCLEKDREQRFQSARDLAFNLETLTSMSSASQTLSQTPRPATGMATTATGAEPSPLPAPAPQPVAALPPTTRVAARPVAKPKPRVSPVLLGLLYLVSIAGAGYAGWRWAGRSEQVVEPQFRRLTFRRGEVRNARFTPDGSTIIYSAAWDGRKPETFVATAQSADARPLGVPESEILAISRSADLAILLRRDRVTGVGTLARVPLGGGMPRELAESVIQADWSPDGTNLAIIRQTGETRIEYPIGTVRYQTPHYVRDVRVSPDGKRLAILEPSRGEYDLAIIEDGPPVTIARGWSRGATGLAWSADGTEVWVSGTATSTPPALYAVSVADGAMRLVTRLTGGIRLFDISRRGEVLLSNGSYRAALAWKSGAEQKTGLPAMTETASVTPAATTTATTTTAPATATTTSTAAVQPAAPELVAPSDSPERDVSWLDWSMLADLSPDGKTILFSEVREGGGAKSAVYLRHADAPAPVHLGDGIGDALSPDGKWALCHQGGKLVLVPTGTGQARDLKIAGTFESGAAWLPDSRRVIVGGVVGKTRYRLYVLDTLDEKIAPVSSEGIWSGGTRAFAVSPDGKMVAGMTSDQTIAVYPIDGSAGAAVTASKRGEIPIAWSADGTFLYAHDPTELPARVYRLGVTDGSRAPWKEFTPADPAGVYKIAPVLVTPDGNAYAYNAMRVLSDLYVAEGLK